MSIRKIKSWGANLGPGIVVAATGVGAGDLIAASVAGARYGTIVLWAAVVGGLLKLALNEGVARWQLATGETVLEGWCRRLPRGVAYYFGGYLLLWAFVVAGALMAACGLAAHTVLPLLEDERLGVLFWGAIQSFAAAGLVWAGRYALIEQVMKGLIAFMFVVVVGSAVVLAPGWRAVAEGIFWPRMPEGDGAVWLVLGLIGGVGGSVTLLSYAYWLKEKGWSGSGALGTARVDLGTAYLLTSVFGAALIVIAAGAKAAEVEGYGMIVSLAGQLEQAAGQWGYWAFLLGFWGAVFSSMLGVWDGVPYLFADFLAAMRPARRAVALRRSPEYKMALLYLALPPLLLLLFGKPAWIGVVYAVTGAFFMPFLAALLLYMNNRKDWLGPLCNGWAANLGLLSALLLFLALFLSKLLL
ncbi:Nramp family divalent metal transporter [Phaeodactylibacter luteus]|uniref:Nramp family divalent metal transporter n=1 Tax=Phaeodactylibacter luteus TaxID=1564516 RepID=UPI001B86E025|nr:Nramp family divalent metal transporter [Phaeodactylibacter luteus]